MTEKKLKQMPILGKKQNLPKDWRSRVLKSGDTEAEMLKVANKIERGLRQGDWETEPPKELMECRLNSEAIKRARFQACVSEGYPLNVSEFVIGDLIKEITDEVLQAPKLAAYMEAQQQNLQIDLQMANDMISDYKGEVAELKAKVEEAVKAENERIGYLIKRYLGRIITLQDLEDSIKQEVNNE